MIFKFFLAPSGSADPGSARPGPTGPGPVLLVPVVLLLVLLVPILLNSKISTSLPGGNQVDGLPPVFSLARWADFELDLTSANR